LRRGAAGQPPQGNASTLTKGEVDQDRAQALGAEAHRTSAGGVFCFASVARRRGGIRPKPRSYRQKVNDRTRRAAFFGTLAERIREGAVRVIDTWDVAAPKTKPFAALRGALKLRKMLCVGMPDNRNALLSARNVAGLVVHGGRQPERARPGHAQRPGDFGRGVAGARRAFQCVPQDSRVGRRCRTSTSHVRVIMKDPHAIIKSQIITEKGTEMATASNQYQFRVAPRSEQD